MRGDREGLLQLVGNLVGNALHYTPRGGRVTVSLARAGERARLQVEDSGIGIPAADLPRIFDEFFRASNARERRTDGTGLGLAIVNAVAVQHGGSVQVESEVGRGTRFTVELPLAGAGVQGPAR
jgi:two-component system phosphate regulon sensor histidine kinase PhoR